MPGVVTPVELVVTLAQRYAAGRREFTLSPLHLPHPLLPPLAHGGGIFVHSLLHDTTPLVRAVRRQPDLIQRTLTLRVLAA